MWVISKSFYNLSVAAMVAAASLVSSPVSAGKAKGDYVYYEESINDRSVANVYNTATGTTSSIVSESDNADHIYSSHTALSGVLVSSFGNTGEGGISLYSTNIPKGTRVQLSEPLVAGGNVVNFAVTDSNKFAFYLADQETDEKFELYYTSTKKRKVQKLSSVYDDFVEVDGDSLRPLPNGKGTFYNAYNTSGSKTGLFLSIAKEPLPREVFLSGDSGFDYVRLGDVSSRSTGAVFTARLDSEGNKLYYYDIKSKKRTEIVTEGITNPFYVTMRFDPSGKAVYYTAYDSATESSSLYKFDIKSSTVSVVEKMDSRRYVGDSFYFDSKGKTLYYSHDKEATNTQVLYSMNLKTMVSTRISQLGFNLEGSMIDSKGNLYFATIEAGTFKVYVKPAKKGDVAVFYSSNEENAYLMDFQLSATGQFLLHSYFVFDGDFTITRLLKNLLTGELFNISEILPGGRRYQILDSIELMPARLIS